METMTLPNGHVVIPLEICRRLCIEAGMHLDVELDEKTGCIRLRPVHHMFTRDGNFTKPILRKLKVKSQGK